jgi:hypothetical protein
MCPQQLQVQLHTARRCRRCRALASRDRLVDPSENYNVILEFISDRRIENHGRGPTAVTAVASSAGERAAAAVPVPVLLTLAEA